MTQTAASSGREGQQQAERYLQALILGIPLVYLVLFAIDWNRVGSRDLDEFLVFHQLQYWNHELFSFAKQWTPLLCSGLSLAGEPQVPLLSLSMVSAYVLGPLRGIELATLVYLIWGWVGAYLYAGLCTRERTQRLLAASLFIGNGFFICRIGYGHLDFVPFLVLPSMLWLLHRMGRRDSEPPTFQISLVAPSILALAAIMSLVVDGSPVSILHLLLWVVCYALVQSVTTRSALPIAAVVLAGGLAATLDAGYLWPMFAEQVHFPRLTADSFTNPLALPWFMLMPVRGKLILPATGNGHELSVFIGPVIALALWRYRKELLPSLPAQVRYPLVIVSAVSIWLGMGSLHAVHLPAILSPFDWLRPLPGFRSIGVTARYWGFLALPLSLLGAMALRRFALAPRSARSLQAWMIFALALQFGFQAETLASQSLSARSYSEPAPRAWSADGGERIQYVYSRSQPQGAFITPEQGVIDCYDNDDFTRAHMQPGSDLVQEAHGDTTGAPVPLAAGFVTWDRIRITPTIPMPARPDADARVVIALNQAWHRFWRSSDCDIEENASGNMVATCDRRELMRHPIELRFHDSVSALGARVSVAAWTAWLGVTLALVAVSWRLGIPLNRRPALQRPQSAAPHAQ